MENVDISSLEGRVNLDTEIKIPEKRFDFWMKAMNLISQEVANGKMTEEQANEERARIISQKEIQATKDTLTNLTNRRGFEEYFERERATAKRSSSCLSLLFIDADDLKEINNLGHDKGDEFLIKVTLAIEEAIRAGDIGARWAGDEFVVLCLGSNLEGAILIADRILSKVRSYKIEGKNLSVSIGAGQIELSKETSLDEQLQIIDQALLQAKKTGKNKVVSVNLNG